MNLGKLMIAGAVATQGLISSQALLAENIDIELTNLTQGLYFTPLLFSVHDESTHLYQLGQTASAELQAMAEGGDISGLQALIDQAGGMNVDDSESEVLAPASTTQILGLEVDSDSFLSITGMILPTNDGFVALNGWKIPSETGTYTIFLNAYDAGTEANDEIVNGGGAPGTPGIPANPGANGGVDATGVTFDESNTMVHVHRGNVGDTDLVGGTSDLDSRIHRWLNPVAKVTVTVN